MIERLLSVRIPEPLRADVLAVVSTARPRDLATLQRAFGNLAAAYSAHASAQSGSFGREAFHTWRRLERAAGHARSDQETVLMNTAQAATVLADLRDAVLADVEAVDSVILSGLAGVLRKVADEIDAIVDARAEAFADAVCRVVGDESTGGIQ